MHRILPLLFFLVLATTIPLADALAQSSAGRGAVGGAIIGGAIGGRRGAAVGAIAGAAAGSRRHWHSHYYLASWSLLGPHAQRIASGSISVLPLRPVCRPRCIRPQCRLAPAILSGEQVSGAGRNGSYRAAAAWWIIPASRCQASCLSLDTHGHRSCMHRAYALSISVDLRSRRAALVAITLEALGRPRTRKASPHALPAE